MIDVFYPVPENTSVKGIILAGGAGQGFILLPMWSANSFYLFTTSQ